MINNIPKVSVIIPTYNRDRFILRVIESVMSQTYKDYEIIVVDDGSTDQTRAILKPLRNTIRYIYQENRGVSAARNRGIREAKGNWVAFLDSDDIWLPEKLACQMEFINNTHTKICFTNYIIRNSMIGKEYTGTMLENKRSLWEPLELILKLPLYVQTMVGEKSLFKNIGGFDETLEVCEDTKLIYQLAFEVNKFGFIGEPYVSIDRSNDRNRLTNYTPKSLRTNVIASATILSDAYKRSNGKELNMKPLRKRLGYYLSRKAEVLCVDKDWLSAERTAIQGFIYGGRFKTRLRCLLIFCFPWLVHSLCKQKYS